MIRLLRRSRLLALVLLLATPALGGRVAADRASVPGGHTVARGSLRRSRGARRAREPGRLPLRRLLRRCRRGGRPGRAGARGAAIPAPILRPRITAATPRRPFVHPTDSLPAPLHRSSKRASGAPSRVDARCTSAAGVSEDVPRMRGHNGGVRTHVKQMRSVERTFGRVRLRRGPRRSPPRVVARRSPDVVLNADNGRPVAEATVGVTALGRFTTSPIPPAASGSVDVPSAAGWSRPGRSDSGRSGNR